MTKEQRQQLIVAIRDIARAIVCEESNTDSDYGGMEIYRAENNLDELLKEIFPESI